MDAARAAAAVQAAHGAATTGPPRLVLDALLWLGKTGAPWRDLPERFGPWRTVATRFYRWTRSGLWDRILAELRRIADAKGGIDWEVHLVDGASVRAHRCAAGGKGGGSARRWAAAAAASAASCTSGAIERGRSGVFLLRLEIQGHTGFGQDLWSRAAAGPRSARSAPHLV